MEKVRDLSAHTWLTWGASAYGVFCLGLAVSTRRRALFASSVYFTAAITGNVLYNTNHFDSS